jgi:predicted dehydrogenase
MDSRRHFLGKVATGLAGTLAAVPARALGASDRIRVGIVGVGDRGLDLLNQIRVCGNTEVVAFADAYSKRLEKAAHFAPSAAGFTDYRRLLDNASIDAVVIATPPHLHAEQFCAALEAGKHVYQEKTLANTLDHTKRMRAAYEKDRNKHTVQIGHQACSFGHLSDVAQFLTPADRMGQISALVMRNYRNTPRHKPQWARPALLTTDVNPQNVAWHAFAGETLPGATQAREFDANRFIHWRYFWDYAGGNVSESMSQQLAFWYQALGLRIPRSATMSGGNYLWDDGRETPDTMDVSLDQPEQMMVSWSSGFGNNQLGMTEDLLGSHGTISRGNHVRYAPQKVNRPDDTERMGRASHLPHAHMENFFDSIRAGREPNCPFETGYRVTVACLMAVASYRTGRTVQWNAETEEIT